MSGQETSRVLFLPAVEAAPTSERAPALVDLLAQSHEVRGLPAPRDRFLYDPDRPKLLRYLLYLPDKVALAWRALRELRSAPIDLVFCETPHHGLAGLLVARLAGVPCVWDSHGNVVLFSESVGKGRVYSALAGALERWLGRRVDLLLTVTERDATAYEAMGVPPSRIRVVPTCVDLGRIDESLDGPGGDEPDDPGGPPVLLFFGSFKYEPNRDALRWINDVLAPFLETQGVSCRIRVAGRHLPAWDYHTSVKPLGFVPNIHATIREADLCIVPVWKGVGILTKVLDIFAVGKPSVLSDLAAQSVAGVEPDVHAFVATEAEFCHRVLEALNRPETWDPVGHRARALAEARYDWARQWPRVEESLRGLNGGGS